MFIIIILLSIMGLMSTDLFVPSLPQISHIFSQTQNITQLTISLFLVGFAFSQLFYGPISDYLGRKRPLIFGVALFILGSFICVNATSFTALCLGRVIQGLGVGAGLSLSRVVLRDRYTGKQLAVKSAQVAMFVSLTPAVAPFIGGLLQENFGYRAPFIFMFCYGLLLLILMYFFKETNVHPNNQLSLRAVLNEYQQLIKQHTFIRFATIAGLAFSSIIIYANVVPYIIQSQLLYSATVSGTVLLFAALGLSFSSFISSRLVKTISPKKLIKYGLIALTLSGYLLITINALFGISLYTLMPMIFLITMGCGFVFPNAIAVCFSDIKSNIGIAGALYGSLQTFVSLLFNLLLNNMPHQGPFLLGALYLIIGTSGLMLCRQQHSPQIQSAAVTV